MGLLLGGALLFSNGVVAEDVVASQEIECHEEIKTAYKWVNGEFIITEYRIRICGDGNDSMRILGTTSYKIYWPL